MLDRPRLSICFANKALHDYRVSSPSDWFLMCLFARLERFVWSDLESYSRKWAEALLGGPSCFKSGLKIWISRVAKVKLQIRIKINERKKRGEAKQSVRNDLKNIEQD